MRVKALNLVAYLAKLPKWGAKGASLAKPHYERDLEFGSQISRRTVLKCIYSFQFLAMLESRLPSRV
jgi:hypothetical protein